MVVQEPPPKGTTNPYKPLAEDQSDKADEASQTFGARVWGSVYGWGLAYHGLTFTKDVPGGCLLAVVVLMQGVACATIADISVVHGPYCSVVPALIYGFVGTSRHLSVGGGALVALVVAEQVHGEGNIEARTRTAIVLALLSGLMMICFSLMGLAFLVRFMSRPALAGLVTGCGLKIIASQLKHLLGLTNVPGGSLATVLIAVGSKIMETNLVTFLLSTFLILLLLGFKYLKGRGGVIGVMVSLKDFIAVVLGTVLAMLIGHFGGRWMAERPIAIVGEVPAGLPNPIWPLAGMTWDEVHNLAPGALVIVLTSYAVSFASAKTVSLKEGYKIIPGREMFALGLSSALGACFGAMPIQGSLNRTALAAGVVRSQFGAGIMVAIVGALVLQFATPVLAMVPLCNLAALIVTAAIGLVDFQKPVQLYKLQDRWQERSDLLVWIVAFLATVTLGILVGIFACIALSIVLVIYEVVQPGVEVLGRAPNGMWIRLSNAFVKSEQVPGALVVRVDGPLFFANAEYFQDRILEFEQAAAVTQPGSVPLSHVVLEASKITFLDATSVEVLRQMAKSLKDRGVAFSVVEAPHRTHVMLQHNLPDLHPKASKGYRVSINELLGLSEASYGSIA